MPLLSDETDLITLTTWTANWQKDTKTSNQILALMLDFDGTLAPIVDDPMGAALVPGLLPVLKSLVNHPQIKMAFVSGRSIDQLRHFLSGMQDEDTLFCGMHGGEIFNPKTQTYLREFQSDVVKDTLPVFTEALVAALDKANFLKNGIFMEKKNHSIVMHYRMLDANYHQAAVDIFHQQVDALKTKSSEPFVFKVQAGKTILELLPAAFDKGDCVRFLMDYWQSEKVSKSQEASARRLFPFYMGDDITDEYAFGAVNQYNGLSVVVGKPLTESEATHAIADELAVSQVLTTLAGK